MHEAGRGELFARVREVAYAALGAGEVGAEILEIGPGLGVLTEGLLARGCSVTAIEKDPFLADRLAEFLDAGVLVPQDRKLVLDQRMVQYMQFTHYNSPF